MWYSYEVRVNSSAETKLKQITTNRVAKVASHMAIRFIISMVQSHVPEWPEVNFTFNMRQKGRKTSIPNNSYKNVKG